MLSRAEIHNYKQNKSAEDEQRFRRIQSFEQEMRRNPGAAPGGTGPTGIGRQSRFAGAPSIGGTGVHAEREYMGLQKRQQQYSADTAEKPTMGRSGYGGGVMRGGGGTPAAGGNDFFGGGEGGGDMAGLEAALAGLVQQSAGPGQNPAVGRRGPGGSGMGDEFDALEREVAGYEAMRPAMERGEANRNAPGTPNAEQAQLRQAGVGEEILDMQAGGEADRYFDPMTTAMRGQEYGNEMDLASERYTRPEEIAAGAVRDETAGSLENRMMMGEQGQQDRLLQILNSIVQGDNVFDETSLPPGMYEALVAQLQGALGGGG